jgi:hypothetical protein
MLSLSNNDIVALALAVIQTLRDSFGNPADTEPQMVARLAKNLPRHISEINLESPTKVSAGSVFIHSRPYVTWDSFVRNGNSSVEIGDVLFVRRNVRGGKIVESHALMLQAKKIARLPATPDNVNQWYLYQAWPRFKYTRGVSPKRRQRSRIISEPDMYDAAKFLLIGGPDTGSRMPCASRFHWGHLHYCRIADVYCHYTAQPTTPALSRYRCFACELLEFIAGNAGKIFTEPKSYSRGWDRVIEDLLEDTAKAKTIYMGRAAGTRTPIPRGMHANFLVHPSSEKKVFANPRLEIPEGRGDFGDLPPWPDKLDDGEGDRGISTIEIVIENEIL